MYAGETLLNTSNLFKLKHNICENLLYADTADVFYPPTEYRTELKIKYKSIPCKCDTTMPDYDGQTETVNADYSMHQIDLSLEYEINKGDVFKVSKYPTLELRASTPVKGNHHQEIYLTNRSYN